uniref:Uncharacterized protein n=1 Tax=Panagrellus redivivus TaxID=6233 RepID=A0A7E4VLD9_PANRE
MSSQIVVATVFVAMLMVSTVMSEDYLDECMNAYERIIRNSCDYNGVPCYSDETAREFGSNPSAATIRLAIECCETATAPDRISSFYCCKDDSCFKRCETNRIKKSLRARKVQKNL